MKGKILYLAFGLVLFLAFGSNGWSDDERYPIMKPDRHTLRKWIETYKNAPRVFIDRRLMKRIPFEGSIDLLNHLRYKPKERNQGVCGNCWLWAGTGVMEIALDVQRGIKDRLSIQYVNSCFTTMEEDEYACCGGWLEDVANIYTSSGMAIPWSNINAYFQDARRNCPAVTSSNISCESISKCGSYDITSIDDMTIETQSVDQATAIANIKNVLQQNRGVWFGFFLPTYSDWDVFYDFWNYQDETDVWNPDYSCGHIWVEGEGGGHAVLIVGYNDDDPENRYWIALNSWGTETRRPNGLFRIDMDINYSCTFYDDEWYESHYFQTLDIEYYECPAGEALDDDVSKLGILRKMRDNKMAGIEPGASRIEDYYRYAGEISSILRANKDLKMMTMDVVEKIVEKAAVLNSNGKVRIDQRLIEGILGVADEINEEASPGLKIAIKKVKREIKEGTIFKLWGITIR